MAVLAVNFHKFYLLFSFTYYFCLGGRQLQTIPIIGQEKTDFSTFKSAVPLDQVLKLFFFISFDNFCFFKFNFYKNEICESSLIFFSKFL